MKLTPEVGTIPFKLRNVIKETCQFCGSLRLESLKFNDFCWLPDPESSAIDPNKYLSFSSLYGKETSEKFRPSLSEKMKGKTFLLPDDLRMWRMFETTHS